MCLYVSAHMHSTSEPLHCETPYCSIKQMSHILLGDQRTKARAHSPPTTPFSQLREMSSGYGYTGGTVEHTQPVQIHANTEL